MQPKSDSGPRKILVVDDDNIALEAMATGLRRAGFEVAAAESGEAALDLARQQKFDLALVDMRMPGMSGAQAARMLLTEHDSFSLILSGHDNPDYVNEAMEDGALGYLVKPFEVTRMIPTINAAIIRARELASLIKSHEHLGNALKEGRETSMVVGIFMERLRLDRQSAFERLRNLARSRRKRVSEVAAEILAAVESLNQPPPGPG